jgi:Domain of unknown function (DUF3850)
MKIHDLKTWPSSFQSIMDRKKRFDIRINDRGFGPGDVLLLQEWDPDAGKYTGRTIMMRVTYMVQGQYGLPDNLCVMGIEP